MRSTMSRLGRRPVRLAVAATLVAMLGVGMTSFGNSALATGVATTVGQTFLPSTANSCGTASNSLELFQTGRADGTNYAVPSDGVITSWSFHGSNLQGSLVTLRVYRPTPPGTPGAGPDRFRPMGDGGPVTNRSGDQDIVTPTRLSVKAGDIVGLRSERLGGVFAGTCAADGGAGDTYRVLSGATPTGFGVDASYFQDIGLRIDVSANVESDADGDGYGDLTQDSCPRLASTQDPCPIPNTKITHHPADPTRHRTARFKFTSNVAGATFQCKLDKHPYRSCTSPHEITVRPGRHTFKVRAHANRATDPTPATYRWRVRRQDRLI